MLLNHVGLIDLETVAELDWFLETKGYTRERRQRIKFRLFMEGSLESAMEDGLLARHHENAAYAVIEAGLPEVPLTALAWDEDCGRWAPVPDDSQFLAGLDDDTYDPTPGEEAERLEIVYGPRFSIAG
jgi:hypothetical protein